jgi:hypothetical protein
MIRSLPTLKIILLSITLYLSLTSCAHAGAENSEFEEQQFLFLIEEAYTQEKGEWQVSFVSQYFDRQKLREFEYEEGEREEKKIITDQWFWITELEYGLTDWLQVEMEVPFGHLRKRIIEDNTTTHLDEIGIGDVETGISMRLFEENDAQWWSGTVSTCLTAIFPTGDWEKDMGTDHFGWEASISISKMLNECVIHLKGGIAATNDARE